MFKLLVLLGLLGGVSYAQTVVDVTQTRGVILTAAAPVFGTAQVAVPQTLTGASTLAAQAPLGAEALGITYNLTVAGTATVQTEVSCGGGPWIAVIGSVYPLVFGAAAAAGVDIEDPLPQCAFRTNVTAIAGVGAAVTTITYFTVRE